MRRFVSILLGIILTLGLVGSVALWIQSYPGQIHTKWNRPPRYYHLDSYGGKIYLQWMDAPSGTTTLPLRNIAFGLQPTDPPRDILESTSLLSRGLSPTFGVNALHGDFKHLDPASTWSFQIFSAKWWFITAVCTLLWGLWLRVTIKSRSRRRRNAKGLCQNCGYDLRATPSADGETLPRCPECGVRAS